MTDRATILLTIASTAVGSAASWFISRRYYRRSGSDLDAALRPLAGDNQKLLQATNTLGRMLKQAGLGEPSWDAAGNLIGLVIRASAGDVLSVSDCAVATITRAEPPRYDRQHEQPPPDEQVGPNA